MPDPIERLGAAIRAARRKRGWSQTLLARELVAASPGVDSLHQVTVSAWERGAHLPRIEFRPALRRLLGPEVAELLDCAELAVDGSGPLDTLRTTHGRVDDRQRPGMPHSGGDAREKPTKRRQAVRLGVVAAGLLPVGLDNGTTDAVHPWSVDTSMVDAHAGLAEQLVSLYHQVRPDMASSIIGAHADALLGLLSRPTTPTNRRRLAAIVVGAHAQAGVSAFHAGDLAGARRYLATGCDVAEESGDPTLEAQVLCAAAERVDGTPRGSSPSGRALRLFKRARHSAQRADAHTRAWVEICYAESLAAADKTAGRRCEAALALAQRLLDAPAPHARSAFFSPAGKFYGLTGHLRSARGLVAVIAGRTEDAGEIFSAIVERPQGPRQRVINLVHLGAAHVAADEPEAACAALRAALEGCHATAYAMGVERVRGVRVRFPARWAGLPCVADLDGRLRAWLQRPSR